MLLKIIFVVVVIYLFYNLLQKHTNHFSNQTNKIIETFGAESMFMEGNFIVPNCDSGKCLSDDFNLNNINLLYRYANNNNFKAKQNVNSILKPKYLF
jgi:hypothetical protein